MRGGVGRTNRWANEADFLSQIHTAVGNGNLLELKRLLRGKPARLNERDEQGRTPLLAAICERRFDIFVYLIQQGADVNAGNSLVGFPLTESARARNAEMVVALLNRNADVTKSDVDGLTALDYAILNKDEKIAKALRDWGAIARFAD